MQLCDSSVAQMVKSLPAMQETWVWSLGEEDPLEKEMATHSSTLAWKTPWMEEPGGLQSIESQRVGNDWATLLSLSPWTFFGIVFLRDRNENWPFSSPVATAQFSKFAGMLSVAVSQRHLLGFETELLSRNSITSTSFVHTDASQGTLEFIL